jgi:hypothetical protein
MIAFVLLRIAANRNDVDLPPLRFSELVGRFLFARRPIDRLDRPPPKYQAVRRSASPKQLELCYA